MTSQVTHLGVTLHSIRRFETDCFVHVIDLTKAKIKLTYPFSSVTDAVTKNVAQLGFNGGGWKNAAPNDPNEFLIIEGKVISAKAIDFRPWIHVSKDNKITIGVGQPNFNTSWNVWGFDRIIAQSRIYNTKINDESVNPRTIYGKDSVGRLVVLVCEGRRVGQKGLTFKECWSVMQEFDVVDCGNADGGYSSAAVNTEMTPNLLNKAYLVENRRVIHQVLFFATPVTIDPDPIPNPEPEDEFFIYHKGDIVRKFIELKEEE